MLFEKKSSFVFKAIAAILILSLFVSAVDASRTEIIDNYRVIDVQKEQIISGTQNNVSTEYRYIVVTDKETFICKIAPLNKKFNETDIFYRLVKGNSYSFEVAGFGKTLFTDYRNIIEIIK
ncbi:MAG: hypothetical protein ABIP51_20565 [Bacteroidia bacterium]